MDQIYTDYPLVSVVIPTYNQGEYLQSCIDHVIFQAYPNIEIIIVDGGSNDNTKEILNGLDSKIHNTTYRPICEVDQLGRIQRSEVKAYPQNRIIKTISFKDNIGATRTYNEGLVCAKGKYCTYIVGDDLAHPHMISEMVGVLEKDKYDFVYSDMNLINDNGNILFQILSPDYDFEECFVNWYKIGVSKLYKTTLHDKVGLMDESYESANDYDHYLRFAIAGCKFYHLSKVLYSVRWHGPQRQTGQHSQKNYQRLISESKECAQRAWRHLQSRSR